MDETSNAPVESFSGKKAADVVGISYRQLDYWARTDLIRPSLADAQGSGSRRRYSYRDLLELKLVKTLLEAGIKLESIREAFVYLRDQLGEDLSTAKLVIVGNSAVWCGERRAMTSSTVKGPGRAQPVGARRGVRAGRRGHRRSSDRDDPGARGRPHPTPRPASTDTLGTAPRHGQRPLGRGRR